MKIIIIINAAVKLFSSFAEPQSTFSVRRNPGFRKLVGVAQCVLMPARAPAS